MRLKDLNIGLQLRLGLGLILVLVALLGALAWQQADALWQETRRLHEHPFTVTRAVGDIKASVLAMQKGMRELFLAETDEERRGIIQEIEAQATEADRQLSVVYAQYLGPRADVEATARALAQWKPLREEVIGLLREGRHGEAASRFKQVRAGVGQEILERVQVVAEFARQRAERFYHDALRHKEGLFNRLGLVLAGIILLTLAISYLLLQGIRGPLRDLTGVATAYGQGDLAARSGHASANEFGELALAFNRLLDTVQAQSRRQENAVRLAQAMLGQEDLRAFCRDLLQALLERTGSQAGAVYLLGAGQEAFEHLESIGLGAGARASFAPGEGQLGQAILSGQVQVIAGIPEDTPFVFATAAGDFRPRALMTIPIMAGGQALAAVCLASLKGYGPEALELVGDVLVAMSGRLGGVLAFQRISELAAKLEEQNRELETQQRELSAQAAELSEQNIELEMQKRQLDQANRLKSSFLANMSHELRTPLNSVIALSGVLERRLAGAIPAEEHGYLGVIERNGKSLLELINNLLDLSRIEAGREQIRPSTFALPELVGEVTGLIEPQAAEKGLELRASLPTGLPPLYSDPEKCRHILLNLLANAVKFTDAGHVEISAACQDHSMRVVVSDTGIGIAAEHLPYIFDEFRQADGSASRRHGGTGLGLAIAKKYANLLGGRIAVKSQPGQGSTFTLTLPLSLPGPNGGQAPAAPGRGCPPGGQMGRGGLAAGTSQQGLGRRILVVEDSEPAIVQLTDILAGQGYQVAVARDGRQALEQVASQKPEAMVLDLMMPEVDGFQVLGAIRSAPGTANLPVLILTAKHVTGEELSFLQGNNVHQLIQKGDVSKNQLLAAIAGMLPPRPGAGDGPDLGGMLDR
ncbi:MAG: response regulator [Desulfarculus sp.]|nr:response regulator [Desulfarculus sp.]